VPGGDDGPGKAEVLVQTIHHIPGWPCQRTGVWILERRHSFAEGVQFLEELPDLDRGNGHGHHVVGETVKVARQSGGFRRQRRGGGGGGRGGGDWVGLAATEAAAAETERWIEEGAAR